MDEARLTVVCSCYQRYREIHVLIHSWLCQTRSDWKLLLIHDGPDARMEAEVLPYTRQHDNITFLCTPVRHNDWGYTPRQIGLDLTDTEFVMFTNDDNYYIPQFAHYMFEAIEADDLDLVLCNMIHSHRNPGVYHQDDYHVFESFPRLNYVDIGNFIVRTDRAQAVGFVGIHKPYAGDGIFMERLIEQHNVVNLIGSWKPRRLARFPRHDPARKTLKIGKVDRVLFVHN